MNVITGPTKVTLDGKGALTLRPADYLASGGEGTLYRRDAVVVKLYHDERLLKSSGQADKLRLLSGRLVHPMIVAPAGLVYGSDGAAIGYYMKYTTGEAYPRLMTSDYWQETGWNGESVRVLTEKMRTVVQYVHDHNALMVDGNELNWLADVSDIRNPTPFAIDVDSWQIDGYKATAIMPSIRDWHAPTLGVGSDWFAYAVVTFALFSGIHPYRGVLPGYKAGELARRMRDRASVFTPGIRLNHAVRDFSLIPGPLRSWYQAVFSETERGAPPSPLETGAGTAHTNRVLRMVQATTSTLTYEKYFGVPGDPVVAVWPCGVARLQSGALVTLPHGNQIGTATAKAMAVVRSKDGYLLAEQEGVRWQWRSLTQTGTETVLSLPLVVERVFRSDNRLFAVTATELVEVECAAIGRPFLLLGRRWPVVSQTTTWWDGVGVAHVLGATHLVLPHDADAVALVRTPELDRLRVVNARAGGRFAVVLTLNAQGDYVRHEFTLARDHRHYQHTSADVDGPELNLTILPKGVAAGVSVDGTLLIHVPTTGEIRQVHDGVMTTSAPLLRTGDLVIALKEGNLFSVRVR